MPRFPERNLDSAVFLYRTEEEARRRERLGGTGFFVGRHLECSEDVFGERKYALRLISNRHVVLEGGACFAVFNRRDGGEPEIIETDQNLWIAHATSDLAVYDLRGAFDVHQYRHTVFGEEQFITPESSVRHNIGVGDDVVMIGRFINLQHAPAIRFGAISAMPSAVSFGNPWPHTEECYAAEMRSRTGFSGSPVAVYRTTFGSLTELPPDSLNLWALLGVNCGYIIDRDDTGEEENTWLNAVIPAWKISELLDTPVMKAAHAEHEALLRGMGTGVKASVSLPPGV